MDFVLHKLYNSRKAKIPNCDKEELVKYLRKEIKELEMMNSITIPVCDNFEDLGITKSCSGNEPVCIVAKRKYIF